MMANWDLRPMLRDLPRLQPDLLLVVGANDRTIPPAKARRVREILPAARIETLPGLGHLAHEERPDLVAELLLRQLQREPAEP
jgi:magnesium chelatase accessory protein